MDRSCEPVDCAFPVSFFRHPVQQSARRFMIVTCPNCSTQYDVEDSDLRSGRKLRCSECRVIWRFRDGTVPAAPAAEPVADADVPAEENLPEENPVTESAAPDDAAPPLSERRVGFTGMPAASDEGLAPQHDRPRQVSEAAAIAPSFAPQDKEELDKLMPLQTEASGRYSNMDEAPPRSSGRHWRILFWIILIAAGATLTWYAINRPEVLREQFQRLISGGSDQAQYLPHISDQSAEITGSGNSRSLTVSGIVTNSRSAPLALEPVRVILLNENGGLITSWKFDAHTAALAPGETISFENTAPVRAVGKVSVKIGWQSEMLQQPELIGYRIEVPELGPDRT